MNHTQQAIDIMLCKGHSPSVIAHVLAAKHIEPGLTRDRSIEILREVQQDPCSARALAYFLAFRTMFRDVTLLQRRN